MFTTISAEHASADPLAAALGYAERGWRVLPLYQPDTEKASSCSCRIRIATLRGRLDRLCAGRPARG